MNAGTQMNYTENLLVDIQNKKYYDSHNKAKIEKIIKRMIDIIGSIFGIVLLIPITIGILIAKIITKDKGPIFFTQKRMGQGGKTFKMYKYRSMVVGADEILEKYLEENEEARIEYKKNKKLKNDPRITKVGKIIRKWSIDEFPQFINVLKGEMSLVGPRPYLPREKEDMENYDTYILRCKPGVTGLWQVTGRNDVSFKDRIYLDLLYYNERCLKKDIFVLLKTVKIILVKEGAR